MEQAKHVSITTKLLNNWSKATGKFMSSRMLAGTTEPEKNKILIDAAASLLYSALTSCVMPEVQEKTIDNLCAQFKEALKSTQTTKQ